MRKALFIMLSCLLSLSMLYGQSAIAHTYAIDKSVKDCLESTEGCDDPAETNESIQPSKEEASSPPGVGLLDVVKMIAALLFVVGLLYFLLKFVNKKSQAYQKSQFIHHFGGTSLGGNRSIQLVRVGDSILIVGVGENVQLLREIDDEEEYKAFLEHYNEQSEQMLQSKGVLTKWLTKRKSPHKRDSSTASFEHQLQEQLTTIKKNRQKAMKEMEQKEQKLDE